MVGNRSEVERITVLETEVANIQKTVDSMDSKLDDLLALRYKGVGAFWLASALLGTGIVGMFGWVFDLFKG